MLFTINNSPFFGKEGKFVTSRHLRDRLFKETEKNPALRIQETNSEDKFLVFGRGILHLSILIETMRREGYELQVGQPQVLFKEIDGQKNEPVEVLVVDVPGDTAGKVIELATQRKGELLIMEPKGDLQHLEFEIPSRGLIGLRTQVLNATQGEAIMTHRFKAYAPFKGQIAGRINGSLISMETGPTTAYTLDKLQDRGRFFVDPGEEVYAGQVVGEHTRQNDLELNLQKAKQLTNMRASGSDTNVKIAPKVNFSLEESMEYIQKDEYLEVTPKSMRMRKIYLDPNERKRMENKVEPEA
jgi:GTP-binding protein